MLSLFKIGSLGISEFLLALEKGEVTSTKPVYKKPSSEPQGKPQGSPGLCKWMSHLVNCSLQFLMTNFQLPHLQDSEKWRGYLFLKLLNDLAPPAMLLPVKSGSRLKQLHTTDQGSLYLGLLGQKQGWQGTDHHHMSDAASFP